MRKGIIVALAALAMGLTGLFASPAKGLQFGFNTGYTSVGFHLHGMGGELLFGFQGQDEHRPKGSVLRIGLAGAAGTSPGVDLTKAKWNGQSYGEFRTTIEDTATGVADGRVAEGAVQAARAQAITNLGPRGITGAFDDLDAQEQAQVDGAIVAAAYIASGSARGDLTSLSVEERQTIRNEAFQGIRDQAITSEQGQAARTEARTAAITELTQGLQAYGINDVSKAKGDATALFVSAAYEYVLGRFAPGLGFIVGGELYVSQGGYASLDPQLPSVSTEGGIGGGGVVGVSYYLKNGFNLTVKTGLGAIDPGKVEYDFGVIQVTVEPKTVFYASPTLALGFIY